ncbi:acyltransferase family protein [Pseudomonas sp. PS01301]|uniref:acyltransferase family protein n=1 Tax=Pseudomonas sp. PS01301 TaxID=2991437 RepID=UPI00249C00B0|nr:acyltransferase family protein [Pseudomonas sp. PS01301]
MTTSSDAALKYRPEIDGLRSLAVLPVILFHAGFSLFSGGFVGVDVFFVISGYLITSIILAEMTKGDFSLLRFYERRARRILPALFVMLLVCLPMAWMWLDPPDLKAFSKSLAAVPLFSSNLLFWRESGYFDAAAEMKPLLHTWTLAVEEQYYLLFPLLLMAGWRLGRRTVVAILAVLALASLALAEHGARQESVAAFYLLHARAWELLVGSFIAFYLARRPRSTASSWHAQAGSLLGVAMIGYGVLAFDHATAFPGFNALLPTVGAGLVILFAHPGNPVGRVLASRPLVGIGLISYSAYLWHQPLFAFARNNSLVAPTPTTMLGLSGLSLVLAWLSWRFVERAFRDRRHVPAARLWRYSASASLLFVALGITGFVNNGFSQRFDVDPGIMTAFEDPHIRDACDTNYDGKGWGMDFCLFGADRQRQAADVAVFGDSHAEALLPAFDAAGKRYDRRIAHIGMGGCPPLLGVDVAVGNYAPGACPALAQREYDYVKAHGIKTVVLVSRWTLYTDGDYDQNRMSGYFLVDQASQARTREASRAVFEKALERTIDAYRALGAQVYVVTQAPQQQTSPKQLYYRLARDKGDDAEHTQRLLDRLSVPYAKHLHFQHYTRALFAADSARERIRLVNLDEALCSPQTCLIGDSGSWYKDHDHLSARGVERVASLVGQIMQN